MPKTTLQRRPEGREGPFTTAMRKAVRTAPKSAYERVVDHPHYDRAWGLDTSAQFKGWMAGAAIDSTEVAAAFLNFLDSPSNRELFADGKAGQ